MADTAYSNAYVFPSNTWIEPGRFLLLGGSNVPNRDLEVNFRMPNRFTNDPTAAVRIVAETGTNTVVVDCLMYGGSASNFNPYGLDTTGWISSNALSAGAGRSLYRRFNGHDTDQVWDWWYTENPTPNPFADISDSDGDGLTDQEELTGSRNPYGEPTNPHNADSDGDGLSDYAECITHGTNPNTWATDDDIYPWPPPSGAASDWWGSDSYEIANGWDPLNPDENTNGIPDSWEMAFPGTNLYGHADNDGISNFDELMQNSNPNDPNSATPQPYVLRYEPSMPGWANSGMTDIGLEGWVKVYFENLKSDATLCLWVTEGNVQEEFHVEWLDAESCGTFWLDNNRTVLTSADVLDGMYPCLLVQDAGQRPDFTGKLGGEYKIVLLEVDLDVDTDRDHAVHDVLDDEGEDGWTLSRGALVSPRIRIDPYGTNPVQGLAKLVIQRPDPLLNETPSKSMRIRLPDSNTRQYLWMVDAGGTNINFDSSGCYTLPLWPSNGATFYAASSYSRKYNDGLPVRFDIELELLISNQVVCSDNVRLTVAPLILPPECYPAEKVYSLCFEIPGVTMLNTTATSAFIQDMVKFTKCQIHSNATHTVAVPLDHGHAGNLDAVLRVDEKIPSLAIWPFYGDGGNIMATPPLGPHAPYGKIMLGTRNQLSAPQWARQGLQPEILTVDTSWLLVGHVDEIVMFTATNKMLVADPWKAADSLHEEIVGGCDTQTLWWGTTSNHVGAARTTTVAKVVIATNAAGQFKRSHLPTGGLPDSSAPVTIVFSNAVFATGDYLRVNHEILSVLSVNGPVTQVARAQGGRPSQAHAEDDVIYALSDAMRLNLPLGENVHASPASQIALFTNELRAALGDAIEFVPMPVLFDWVSHAGKNGFLAATPNLVNSLVMNESRVIMPAPGIACFKNYAEEHVPGAEFYDSWVLHVNAGNLHCGTAAIRSLPAIPPFWGQVESWE